MYSERKQRKQSSYRSTIMQNSILKFLKAWGNQVCGETDLQCEDIVLWTEVNNCMKDNHVNSSYPSLSLWAHCKGEAYQTIVSKSTPGSNVTV